MSPSPSRWAWMAVLAVGPLVLLGGHLVRGDRLLPYVPVGLEPLAHENPELAEHAFDGANFVLGDRIFPIMSDQIAVRGELLEGHLPLWEPDVNLGAPLFAGTLVGPAYPPNWLAVLFPPDRAGVFQGLLTFFLAGLGMALFLGRLGLSPGARVVGVVAYALGGWAVTHVFYFMKVDAALWLPFMLWAVEGLARRKPWSGFCLSASVALSLWSGFPTISFFVLTLVGPWTLLRLGWPESTGATGADVTPRARRWSSLLAGLLFLGLGVVGGSLQVAPMFEASRESRRQDKQFETIVSEAMPPATLLGTVLPDLIGAPGETTEPGKLPTAWWLTPASRAQQAANANPAEWNSYVGLVVVLLALVALVARPGRAWFPVAALALTYGFAQAWPLVRWSYHLPLYNIGAPQRVLSLAWFLWPWLAALGVEALRERAPRANHTFFLASFLCAASTFFVWSGFEPASWAKQLEVTLVERYPRESLASIRDHVSPDAALAAAGRLQRSISHAFAAALAAFVAALVGLITRRGESSMRGLDSPWLFGSSCLLIIVLGVVPPIAAGGVADTLPGVLGGVALVGIFAILTRSWREAAWLPIALAVLCEGGLAARGHLSAFPGSAGECFPPSEALERLAETVADGRLLRVDTSPSGVAEVFHLARPNMPQVYGIADMSTYSIFTAQSFLDLCVAVDPRMEFRGSGVASLPDPALLDHPLLDLMRVTCILSVRPLRHARLEQVVGRDGYYLYRRTGCPPRIRIVPSARRVDSDAAGIELHASGTVDLAQTTLLAPETDPALAGEVEARPYRPGQIERVERPSKSALDIDVWGSSGGYLVLHEQYYPGWTATVNGEDTPLLRADHALRAVRIPRGDSRVEFRYRPVSVSAGFGASLGALVLAAVLSLLARRRAASNRP